MRLKESQSQKKLTKKKKKKKIKGNYVVQIWYFKLFDFSVELTQQQVYPEM